MKIVETTYTLNKNGRLQIPARVLREMGLGPGSHVCVAYLTDDGARNTFFEFYLSANGIENSSVDEPISVPVSLLREANIEDTADLQILCLDGCLIFCRDTGMDLEGLAVILKKLQLANEVAGLSENEREQLRQKLDEITE